MRTLTNVKEANPGWFSALNKRLFGDLSYTVLTGKMTGYIFLIRKTQRWSDMFNQEPRVFFKINPLDQVTLDIRLMLDDEFKNMDQVKNFLKTK